MWQYLRQWQDQVFPLSYWLQRLYPVAVVHDIHALFFQLQQYLVTLILVTMDPKNPISYLQFETFVNFV